VIGQTVQHYRVIGRLGEGGMGVVWLAEDTRLGRQVALKILNTSLSDDPSALERFETEARLASSIAHPHIVSIYDVGSIGDGRFIAMELVDGDNLDRLVATRRLRVDEVVEWALQVADALAAAHRAGVFHRDVKPANIFIARGGYAKLGDFGIAKLFEHGHDPGATMAPGATAGMVLGSPHYLSPEQAQGEPLDARTDVFSFAATLHEMLTGRRAFPGSSPGEVIASVLREDPVPPSRLHPEIPRALDAIVTKGLEKRREYRYQHMDDVVADLRRLKRDLESGRTVGDHIPQRSSGRSRVGVRSAAAVALVGGGILGALIARWALPAGGTGSAERRTYDLARITSEPGLEDAPTWSPDGRSLAYISDDNGHLGISIRQVPGERSIRVGMSGVDEGRPAWSPDGNWIAFVSSRNRGGRFGIFLGSRPIEMYVAGQNGDLFVMPAFGGTARKLADDAYDPCWSPDGSRLAFRSIRDGAWRLYTVTLDGSQIAPIKGVEPRALAPAWSPDGRWIAYVAGASAATGWDVYTVPAEGGTPVPITHDRATITLAPAWSRDGRSIMYSSNRAGPVNLWRVGFNPSRPSAGQRERLTTGIGEDINASAAPDGSSIAYATVHTAPDIWALDVGTRQVRQLTSETTVEDYPRLSPDGERLLFYSDRTGADEVWMMQLATRELTRVSRSGGTQNAWSPDGRHAAYGTSKGLHRERVNFRPDERQPGATPFPACMPF
jgi:Tol biopolymer transport system component